MFCMALTLAPYVLFEVSLVLESESPGVLTNVSLRFMLLDEGYADTYNSGRTDFSPR